MPQSLLFWAITPAAVIMAFTFVIQTVCYPSSIRRALTLEDDNPWYLTLAVWVELACFILCILAVFNLDAFNPHM